MIQFINWIIDLLYNLVSFVLNLLPDSPFQQIEPNPSSVFGQVMGWITYFVPIQEMIVVTLGFLGAVIVWYAYRWILRLARYVD